MEGKSLNVFGGGMNLDSLPSLQPDGSTRVAVNAQTETFDHNSFGLVNEPSNELCFSVPDDYQICGWGLIEERDQFLIFSYNEKTKVSQIGVGNTKTCEYKILLEDTDKNRFLNKFCFSPSERINPQFKNLRPCNDLWVYWSNNFTYYRLNLDGDFCDISYEDLVLFDCKCPAVIEANYISDGGYLLDVGAYQFACQLIDDDENKTNWFSISNPIYLTGNDNKLGDKSDQAVLIEIDRLPKSFPKVSIAVIKTVGGVQTAEVFTKLYHNGRKISYVYRGKDKDDEPIEIKEILSRKTGYIQGKDLVQRDGRLFLYNLKEEWNLDAQKYANKIKTNFLVWAMPSKEAANIPTLPRAEVISLAVVYNFCDGTKTVGFHIPGRKGNKDEFKKITPDDERNCTSCDLYRWQIENTSYIEESYCSSSIFAKSSNAKNKSDGTYVEEETLYIPLTEEDKRWYCKPAQANTDSELEESEDSFSCPPSEIGGIDDCEDCLGQYPGFEVIKGKTICPGDEDCVDGRCPSTGEACYFCQTCGNEEYKIVRSTKQVSYEGEEEGTVLTAFFEDCPEGEPIFDDEGCRVIGYKPAKIAKGKFGYWQSSELYPKTKDCDGNYLYEELAGSPIRHHLVPDEGVVPFNFSRRNGVVTPEKPDNYEWEDTTVYTIGLEVCGVELPPNPPKPYCPNNPVSIYWQKIDPKDSRVTARGLFTHTFLGRIGNKDYAVPKNAVNSLEQFDKHLNYNEYGISHYRGGFTHDLPIYNFHSPDTDFQRIPLTADRIHIPLELSGTGQRYGIYGEGEEPINMWNTTTNIRGARQAINLNQYSKPVIGYEGTDEGFCWDEELTFVFSFITCEQASLDDMRSTFILTVYDSNGNLFNSSEVDYFTMDVFLSSVYVTTVTDSNSNSLLYEYISALGDFEFIPSVSFFLRTGEGCEYTGNLQCFATSGQGGTCACSATVTLRASNEKPPTGNPKFGDIYKCIKDLSYADGDSIVSKGDRFTYPLLNLKREGSVYIELEGNSVPLGNSIDPYLIDGKYNGVDILDGNVTKANNTSDGSFLGDVHCQSCPIYNAAAHYGILLNDSPNQYGRIESATYIPLGMDFTSEEIICGKAERYGIGDSYVGLYSFRRYSYVSDKVGNLSQQTELKHGGNTDILFLHVANWNLFCLKDCSKIPDSCTNDHDRRKEVNLRDFIINGVEKCWNGISRFIGLPTSQRIWNDRNYDTVNGIRDTYHPNTLNTLVHFWTESKINLWKRQTDVCDTYHYDFDKNYPTTKGAEIHYRRLKCLELDPEMPEGTPWNNAWLSRIGIQWQSIAILKKWARTFLKVLILAAIGIAGASLGLIGILIFTIFIFHDGIQDSICSFLTRLLGIRQCLPKCYSGNRNCIADSSKVLPFEKNYTGYNWDYNTQNDLDTVIGMTDPYNTCICDVGEGNQIVYSQKQNPLSITDSYKNFLVNNYIEIPADFGKIKSLFSLNNNFYAHTSDMIINIATADGVIDLGNGQALEVITQGGDLRTMPKELFSDLSEGYGGTVDPNCSINTQFGRFIVDREAKKVFLFTRGLEEISNRGIRNFLKENLDLDLIRQFPNYKNVDEVIGVGYKIGYDNRFNKLLFTKIDYKAKNPSNLELINNDTFRDKSRGINVSLDNESYFINRSFTLSYDPTVKKWISFHTYYPDGYAWDRDHLYSIKDGSFWRHGDKYGEFQTFYGEYFPHVIEFVIKEKNGISAQFTDMEMDVEASEYNGVNWVKGKEKTFNKALFYNDNQSTGEVILARKDSNNTLVSSKEITGQSDIEWRNDFVRINNMVSRTVDIDSPLFDGRGKDGLEIINDENIGNRNSKLDGKYMVARLILDDVEMQNVQHITKRVITTQETKVK